MSLMINNVLTRQKEDFAPLHKGKVNMYVCGPTVYDYPHIGHAKNYIAFDVIVRYLRYIGYDVLYVQNITDVGQLLIDLRAKARQNKDWATADQIRNQLKDLGLALEDRPDGTIWKAE